MEPNFSRFRLVLKQSASYLFIYPGCVGGWGGNGMQRFNLMFLDSFNLTFLLCRVY
jgi:hypothetical protein